MRDLSTLAVEVYPRRWGWIRLEARMVSYLIHRAVCARYFLEDCKFRSYRFVKSRIRSSTQLHVSVLYLRLITFVVVAVAEFVSAVAWSWSLTSF